MLNNAPKELFHLKPTEVFDYYDGTVLYTIKVDDTIYLVVLHDSVSKDSHHIYESKLFLPLTEEELQESKLGKIDMYSAFKRAETVYLSTYYFKKEIERVCSVNTKILTDIDLPTKGTLLVS